MDNIQALKNGSQSQAVFINTILTLKDSQGFYCRLYNAVIDLDGDEFLKKLKALGLTLENDETGDTPKADKAILLKSYSYRF